MITNATIRLACETCDRSDMNGITPYELAAALKAGWKSVRRERSYEDAIKVYDAPADEPPGYSVLDWWTHLGLCPECAAAEDA